jgi:wyosine [tRNA(Phe)-imidazoG37] synthetase (radical SAM superfamily)
MPSRRLGRSLGLDVIPKKLCDLDCIYCEVGPTDRRALRRKEYVPLEEVLAELDEVLSDEPSIDCVTFSGSGEPTLNSKLGEMIRAVKQRVDVPVVVITNGTTLYLKEVRGELLDADIVMPSLDAVTPEVFEKINRPHPQLRVENIVEGLQAFRKEYRGEIWLEILLVKGVNDHDEEILALKKVIDELHPDKIQLNTVTRPPAEVFAEPVDGKRLEEIRSLLGDRCEAIGGFSNNKDDNAPVVSFNHVVKLLERRAMTADEIAASLGMRNLAVRLALHHLEDEGVIHSFPYHGAHYYRPAQLQHDPPIS